MLGIHRNTLTRKMAEYKIKRRELRSALRLAVASRSGLLDIRPAAVTCTAAVQHLLEC